MWQSAIAWPRRAWSGESRPGAMLLVGLVAILVTYKILYGYGLLNYYYPEHDGGYYVNVARNVRDGHGVSTNISLYHKGYPRFPHPTSVYPLWPLILGGLGKVFPMLPAGIVFNTLLYFATLGLGYRWSRTQWPEDLFPSTLPGFHAGHVWVLVVGFNATFFSFTSRPYTEALAYCLLLGLFVRLPALLGRPGIRTGLELGAWLGLLILARSQMVLVTMAAAATLAVTMTLGVRRRESIVMGLAAVASLVLVLLPEYLYIRSFIPNAGPSAILRFDQNRPNELLSAVPVLVPTSGLWDYVKDRAPGFLVAFDPTSDYGLDRTFHGAHWGLLAVIPATAAWLISAVRRPNLEGWRARLSEPRALTLLFVVILALGGYFSLHTLHKVYGVPWNFGRRQALMGVFLCFLALVWLLRRRKVVTYVLAVVILSYSSWAGLRQIQRRIDEHAEKDRPKIYRQRLVQFLLGESRRLGRPLTVVATIYEAQRLAHFTGSSVNYHWVYWNTTREDFTSLIHELNVDYVLMPKRFPGSRRLQRRMERMRSRTDGLVTLFRFNLNGMRVYRPPQGRTEL